MTSLSEVKQYWTVTIALLSEREVELRAALDNDPGLSSETVRCPVHAGLEQLELLFACTPDAEFRLAVRAPDGAFSYLTTRRWRFALYFISAQYERAFVSAASDAQPARAATRAPARSDLPVRAGVNVTGVVSRDGVAEPANDTSANTRKAHG